MIEQANRLGIFGIPGTFPTGKVLDQVKRSDPQGLASQWTRSKINDAWVAYKEGVEKGAPPWTQTNRQVATYMSENINISLSDANMFGFALYTLSQAGEISNIFYTAKDSDLINLPAGPESLYKLTKTIKWVAIGTGVAVGLYFTWPLLTKARTSLKKRLAHG